MIDLNVAEPQGTGGAGPIPPDSIVPFKMTIRPPKAGKEGSTHALFCKSSKGNEYIDVEFEALGSFAGRKIWQNFTLVGSDAAAKISMRTLRAIVESSRMISPSDSSPAASAGRQLSDWADFNAMTFLVKVKCVVEQSTKDGQWYVNNEINRIITPDDKEYAAGEFISDKPIPAVPAVGESTVNKSAAASGPAAAWGPAPTGPAPTGPTEGTEVKKTNPVPAWAAR